jgi:hypothetical protein
VGAGVVLAIAIAGAAVVARATVVGGTVTVGGAVMVGGSVAVGGAVAATVTVDADSGGAALLQLAMANATPAVPSTRCNERRRRTEPGDSRSDVSKSGGLIESLRCRSGEGMPDSVLTPRTVAAMLDLQAQVQRGLPGVPRAVDAAVDGAVV